jgi:tetratricopeptide (TPR) repeat protein
VSTQQCRTNLLLEDGLSETHWILATRYAFNACVQPGRREEGRGLPAEDRASFAHDAEAAQKRFEELVKTDPTAAANHLGLADCHRLRGDMAAAESALQHAIAVVPGDARPAFQLGELYVLQGRGEEAVTYFTRLAAQGPDAWAARKRVVELLLELGKVSEAAPKLYELFGVTTSDLELHALHGRMLILKGDAPAGTHQLQEVLGQDVTLVRARFQLALAGVRSGRPKVAAAEVTECLRHDSDFLPARYALANLHLEAGQYDLAAEQTTRIQDALPDSFDMQLLASDVARGRGEAELAGQIAERLVKRAPDRCDGHFRLGQARAAQRQYGEALSELERALALSPTSVDVLARLADAMRMAGRSDAEVLRRVQSHAEGHRDVAAVQLFLGRLLIGTADVRGALPVLEAAVQADPKVPEARYLFGEVHACLGHLPDARRQFEQVVSDEPTAVAAQMMLALVDDAEGRQSEAERRYVRLFDIAPKFAPAANNLAWAYARQNDKLDLALERVRQAALVVPDDPYVADTLGWILYRQRLFEPAIRSLKEAAAALPDRAEVRYHLGMAYRRNNNVEPARTELRAALQMGGFAGMDEARQAFSEIDW